MPQPDQPQNDSLTAEPTVEPTVELIPPRYWWLKRIGIAASVLFVALLALRLWWGWEAHRRLQAEIDRIIAAGEPIYPEDFDPKEDIRDEQNAAKFLRDAENAVNLTTDQTHILDVFLGKTAELPKRMVELRAMKETNAEVFDLARRARRAPGVDWGLRIRTPAMNTMHPMLEGQRRLCRLLNAIAYYDHATGHDELAIESLRDVVAQGETISDQPNLSALFAVMGTQGLTARTIEETVPTMKIAVAGERGVLSGDGFASREQVVGLIDDLLDDRRYRSAMTRAMLGERMLQLDIIGSVMDGQMSFVSLSGMGASARTSVWETLISYPIIPLLYSDGLAALRNSTTCVAASEQPYWQQVSAALPREDRNQTFLDAWTHPFSRMVAASVERRFLLQFRALAIRRMAAVALAIRMYQAEHGHRPETLTELVPEYLTALPDDPFAAGTRAFGYLPNASRPVVYSVGSDGIDNEGTFTFRGDRIDPDQLDMPFFLDGNRPTRKEDLDKPTPVLPQTGEDDHNVSENDGKNENDKAR